MKGSMIISIVLLIGLVMTIFGSVMIDMQSQYDNDIQNSSWNALYNSSYTSDINKSALKMQEDLRNIGQSDGFLDFISASAIAIPRILLQTIIVVFGSVVMAGEIMVNAGAGALGIPAEVMLFATVGLIVVIVFSLVNWWHSKTQI